MGSVSNRQASYWAVIPAAGRGCRMGGDQPKQYLSLGSQTILEHTLKQFIAHPEIKGIVVALNPSDRIWAHLNISCDKPLITVVGGEERCHSVLNALEYLDQRVHSRTWILVHDAARPCLALSDLTKLMVTLEGDEVGGILGVPVRDTLKQSGANQRIVSTVDRSSLWHALTPQMFRIEVLTRALSLSIKEGYFVTDEASAVEHIGLSPKLIEGRGDNIKITRPEDLALAKYYLFERRVNEV
jgi:2-C-methyl-D-erythritol 4-phosphate cytidylyltransferase